MREILNQQVLETVDELNHSRLMVAISAVGATAVLAAGMLNVDSLRDQDQATQPVAFHQGLSQLAATPFGEVGIQPSPAPQPSATKRPAASKPKVEAKPSPTSIVLPKLPKAPAPQLTKAPEANLPKLVLKDLSYADIRPNLTSYVSKLPTLPELAQALPEEYPNANEQLAFIKKLSEASPITDEDVANFKINTDHRYAFAGTYAYKRSMVPQAFLFHWTAQRYDSVDQFIQSMRNGHKSVEFFIDRQGTVFQLFDNDRRFPSHALGMNDFTQGVEIEALGLGELLPVQYEAYKLLAIEFANRNDLEADPTDQLTHAMAELLINNPFYNNATGTFHPTQGRQPSLRKRDGPRELVDFALPDIKKYVH